MIRATTGQVPGRFPNIAPCPGAGSPCVDTTANTIFVSGVTSFDNGWTAGEPLAPTAANVSITGRVTTSDGRGLRNAIVSMTDSQSVTRTARTSSFGYYRFDDVPTGESYVVAVRSKQYTFTPRVLNLAD